MTFDFPKRIVYLKKSDRYAEPDRQSLSGLDLRRVGKEVIVHSVWARSPAEKSGVKPDDVILTIQGKPAESYEFFELANRLFVEEGKSIDMTLKRGGETLFVSFVLEPRSPAWSAPQTRPERPGDPSRGAGAFKDLPDSFSLSPLQGTSRPAAGEIRKTGRQRVR